MSKPQCTAITPKGQRCRRYDIGPGGFCLVHDPARRGEWEALRTKGLENARPALEAAQAERARLKATTIDDVPPPLVRTLEGIVQFLGWVAMQVAGGKMDPKRGSSTTYTLTTLRAALYARDLTDELKAAQAEVKKLRALKGV